MPTTDLWYGIQIPFAGPFHCMNKSSGRNLDRDKIDRNDARYT